MRFLTLTSALALVAASPALADPVFHRIASFATTGLEADVIAFLELARKQQWVEV